ncbi:hypothetical protein IMZ48_26150 [Candidatus Bathyarchaeota archaeon]|nr:hypothetical protein [Candidatus Bathyarchaeota archaeon]
MAQDRFTKEEATTTLETVDEMFEAIPKSKRLEYIGHLNDICLFIEAARRMAPEESK